MNYIQRLIVLCCLSSMVSFETIRDLSFFSEMDDRVTSIITDISEELTEEKESKGVAEPKFEIDIDIEERSNSSFIREGIYCQSFASHSLKYDLLEQKVILPPPEQVFS